MKFSKKFSFFTQKGIACFLVYEKEMFFFSKNCFPSFRKELIKYEYHEEKNYKSFFLVFAKQ